MPRQRPAPLAIPPPLPRRAYGNTQLLSPDSTPGDVPTSRVPRRAASFVLKLKRSSNQLQTPSRSPSPLPSPLLSPSLFPLPPSRDDDKENEPPFSRLAPRSPRSAKSGSCLELPASPLLPPLSATPSSASSASSHGWPLTPNTPYTPAKEAYSPSRHPKDLIFPHRARLRPSSALFSSPGEEAKDGKDTEFGHGATQAPKLSTVHLPFPSPPTSPQWFANKMRLPPKTPPRKPTRPLPSPPFDVPSVVLSPSVSSNALRLAAVELHTPPRKRARETAIPPAAPASHRIFTTFPTSSQLALAGEELWEFPHPPTRPRTPPAPRSSTFSSLSSTDVDPLSSPPTSPSSTRSKDSDLSYYPSTPPYEEGDLFYVPPPPAPPRPPRSPLRPRAKPLMFPPLSPMDSPLPPLPPCAYSTPLSHARSGEAETESGSDAESSVDAPAFSSPSSSLPSTPSRSPGHYHRRALPESPSPSPAPCRAPIPLPLSLAKPLPQRRQRKNLHRFLGAAEGAFEVTGTQETRRPVGDEDDDDAEDEEDEVDLVDALVGYEDLRAEVRESRLRWYREEGPSEELTASQEEGEKGGRGYDEELVLQAMERMLWG
ncbi:hypothetical protein JCM6882_000149 [Rhodosporidiobolus microsporus]